MNPEPKPAKIPQEAREAKHFRAPIADTLRRKSPFDSLFEHAQKVHECLAALKEGFAIYLEGDFEGFHAYRDRVSRLEHEADLIKYNARAHLPKSIFMPVSRGDFIGAVSQQDKILDYAEAVADLMDMRATPFHEELRPLVHAHLEQVLECLKLYEAAVQNLADAVSSSFGKRERQETKDLIKAVHKAEWKADQAGNEAKRKVYELELRGEIGAMDEYHVLKIIDWVDEIADRAENASERLRIMVAK